MKKLDQNQKIGLISGAIFVVFLIGFSVLSSLVQGILVFFMFLPLLIAMFFAGKHFKSKNSKIGGQLTFISIALFVFGILQALLGLLGAYGS